MSHLKFQAIGIQVQELAIVFGEEAWTLICLRLVRRLGMTSRFVGGRVGACARWI